MAQADFSYFSGGLDIATVDRGATAGLAAPPGGGDFVFGFNSLAVANGAVALFTNQTNFAPMARGCSVRGCVQRAPSGGATGFSPFLIACAQGPAVTNHAYLLGLSDEDPHRIVLRKGAIVAGLADADAPGTLLKSSESFLQGTWLHLRLDVIVNDNDDVVLQVYRSDLATRPLSGTPLWTPVPGMAEFIDDQLGINAGSQPLTSGRAGFGFRCADAGRRAAFDHFEVWRQL